MNSEEIQQVALLERQVNETEQHMQFMLGQIQELEVFESQLSHFQSSKNKKEEKILASLGKGIYTPANLTDGKLFVEVGAGVIVRKTPEQVAEIIKQQISRLRESQQYLENQLSFYSEAMQNLILKIESENKVKK